MSQIDETINRATEPVVPPAFGKFAGQPCDTKRDLLRCGRCDCCRAWLKWEWVRRERARRSGYRIIRRGPK